MSESIKGTPEYEAERQTAIARLNNAYARFVETTVAKSETPTQSVEDDDNSYGADGLLTPKHDPLILYRMLENSSELGPDVAAMVANTVGYGYRFVKRKFVTAKESAPELVAERVELENLFDYANSRQNLLQVLELAAWDYYLTGNMYLEITRGARGKPDGIVHIPSSQMRATRLEDKVTSTKIKQIVRTSSGYTINERTETLRFRRYAQQVTGTFTSATGLKVWFKEFQDPRAYHCETGEVAKDKAQEREWRKAGKLANEVMHIAAPARRGVYGLPPYIGNVTSVNGNLASENVNLSTLQNNNIPSMFITVSGGQLTPASINRLTEFVESKIAGNSNRSRFVLLESETIDMDELNSGRSRIQIEPLTGVQINDEMFEKYSESCQAKIRRSFRLPEILVGRGSAVSGVVVAASMKLADEQIFSQDRARFFDWINRRLFPELGITNWTAELNSPNATDPATLANILPSAEKVGAMTPNIGRKILELILGQELPPFPVGFDADKPYTLTMAHEVKAINDSGANNPTGSSEPREAINGADPAEPTQQFTSAPIGTSDES